MTDKPWWQMPLLYPGSGPSTVLQDVAVEGVLADIYRPVSDDTSSPIVILIHGGPISYGMQGKNLRLFCDYGRLLAGEGFVAVSFNHSYYGANEFAASAWELRRVIKYMRAAGIGDRRKIILWAFSGGGPLLTVGFDKPYVRALVDYYAVLEGPPAYDPIAHAAKIRVPMLIARAGRDMPQVNEPLKRFLDAALEQGVNIELLNHPGGEHAFDIVTDDARTRQIIGRTLAFLRELRAP